MRQIQLVTGFLTVGSWTMASRVLGFVRDILIAAFLGSGPVAQAFLIAFSLPNLFRRFFAEGAFNMAFVPMYSKRLETGTDADAFAGRAFTVLASILIALTLLALAVMPWLVIAMASGFLGDERFELAVDYGRIAFPYVIFVSLAALVSGVLNAGGRFAAAAAAPVVLNGLFIVGLVLADRMGWDMGLALAWTVPLAGIAQLALVWVAASRAGIAPKLSRPRLTPEIRRLAVVAAPAALAGGVVQINLLVGRQVASFFDGAIVWLSLADRLYQLPLGVVGIAIGVVLLPDLSRRLGAGDRDGGQAAFNRATEITLALTVPAAVALAVVPVPIVSVLFERGAFTAADVGPTALALAVYAVGLPAFVLQKVLQPLFFAREDTRSPLRYAILAMIVNAVCAVGLAPLIGYVAAAMGTTVAAWAMVVQLWLGSRAMGQEAALDARLIARLPRIGLASAIMGAALLALYAAMSPWFGQPTLRYGALALLVAGGLIVYAIAGRALGAFDMAEIRAVVRRPSA